MIGNDVVDLTAAAQQSDWRRKGFLEKVFSAREKEIIFSANDCHQMVWLLWSMKEAAYKARQRSFCLPRLLDWQAFECEFDHLDVHKATGVVKTLRSRFYSTSNLSKELIHTIAKDHWDRPVQNVVLETSSERAKAELLQIISQHFSIAITQLSIKKNSQGVPEITHENRKFFNRFSFSDHGRFAAFTLSLIMS
jgi:phosphopantetheine--protein transferase-like protein